MKPQLERDIERREQCETLRFTRRGERKITGFEDFQAVPTHFGYTEGNTLGSVEGK